MPDDQNLPDTAETEPEKKYTDPESGKEIRFADNVPELLRKAFADGDKVLRSEAIAAQKADTLCHLDRAEKGADYWNNWVAYFAQRWCVTTETDSLLNVELLDEKIENYNEFVLDFSQGQELDENGKYEIKDISFSNFVFPIQTKFNGTTFSGDADFEGATFSGRADFERATFSERADFKSAIFSEEANFEGTIFSGMTYFGRTILNGGIDFKGVTFSGGANFGGAAFNRWANLGGVTFSGRGDFKGVIFSEWTNFGSAIFSGRTNFENATFSEEAYFGGASFSEDLLSQRAVFFAEACWDNIVFHKTVNFSESYFLEESSFENSSFEAFANFDHVHFGIEKNTEKPDGFDKWGEGLQGKYNNSIVSRETQTTPNFRGAVFNLSPNLGYTHVAAPRLTRNLIGMIGAVINIHDYKIIDVDAGSKLRRLQELAAQGHHHLAEKRFFRAELLARRGHEAKTRREIAMINSFEVFSKCGLSFLRPFGWWVAVSLLFAWGYSEMSGIANFSLEDYGHLFNYTLSNSTPILGVIKSGDTDAMRVLFGESSPFLTVLNGAHNIISTIFLFFALLAVRNYFKLG